MLLRENIHVLWLSITNLDRSIFSVAHLAPAGSASFSQIYQERLLVTNDEGPYWGTYGIVERRLRSSVGPSRPVSHGGRPGDGTDR